MKLVVVDKKKEAYAGCYYQFILMGQFNWMQPGWQVTWLRAIDSFNKTAFARPKRRPNIKPVVRGMTCKQGQLCPADQLSQL